MNKPVKVKPHFYSVCLRFLQEIAMEMGYNLIVHGSMSRDLDLVAIPWINDPKSHLELLQAFNLYLNGVTKDVPESSEYSIEESCYMYTLLPGGRSSYIINLNRGGPYNSYIDEQYYLDNSYIKRTR